jgi:hypothetical protein
MKPLDQNYSDDPKTCSGTPLGGHVGQYGELGFSPCVGYIAHQNNILCEIITETDEMVSVLFLNKVWNQAIPDYIEDHDPCQCATTSCPCGEFIAHKVSEPCTAKPELSTDYILVN